LRESAGTREAMQCISLCETLIDLLCNTNLRHAVSADEPFPSDLVAPLYLHMQATHLRQFFEDAYRSPHMKRLHGGMVVPGRGDSPSMTLKELANREETGGINVLGYAAATNMEDAVRLLLQVGADPNAPGANGRNAMDMTLQHTSNKAEMLALLQSVKEVQAISAKDVSITDPDACLRITGRSCAELVAPVWDVLLDGAAATPHPEVCFAILNSLFSTVTAVHPALLENMFIAVISTAASVSGRTPRAGASPKTDDTPSANSEPMSPGVKVSVSCRAERFFKLLALVARKFSKNKGAQHFARTALPALLTLLKLPTSWPLARLCHKLRLVEPTLSELAGAQEVERSAPASSPFLPRAFAADLPEYASEDDDDENQEEEEGHDDEDVPSSEFKQFQEFKMWKQQQQQQQQQQQGGQDDR